MSDRPIDRTGSCDIGAHCNFPASHYVVPQENQCGMQEYRKELEERVRYFKGEDKLLEAQRISERTNFDIEMS